MWYEISVFGYEDKGELESFAGWTQVLRTNSKELAESRKAQLLSQYAEEDVDLNW